MKSNLYQNRLLGIIWVSLYQEIMVNQRNGEVKRVLLNNIRAAKRYISINPTEQKMLFIRTDLLNIWELTVIRQQALN